MQAYFFGEDRRRLLGSFTPARRHAPDSPRPSILICGPHGQEAVRSHRLLRVLADRLSRAGHDVLRFDPYGSGDSAGDDEDLDLDSWQQDIALAAQELSRRSAGCPQVWIGFRLGATAACRGMSLAGRFKLLKLVLVEPVADGPEYLAHLALATVHTLEASMSIKSPAWRHSLATEPEVWQAEAAGFGLGSTLHDQLKHLGTEAVTAVRGVPVEVVVPTESQRLRVLAWPWQHGNPGVVAASVPYLFDWTSEEALNSAWVPNGLVAHLVKSAMAMPADLGESAS